MKIQVQARLCPFTKEIFYTDQAYRMHLLAMREKRNKDRKLKRLEREYFAWAKTVTSIQELLESLLKPSPAFALIEQLVKHRSVFGIDHDKTKTLLEQIIPTSTSFNLTNKKYHRLVSNSHSAPYGKEQNFNRDPKLPLGYPGVSFVLEGVYKINKYQSFDKKVDPFWLFSALDRYGIASGSGSGGSNSFHKEMRIWAEQFPLVALSVMNP